MYGGRLCFMSARRRCILAVFKDTANGASVTMAAEEAELSQEGAPVTARIDRQVSGLEIAVTVPDRADKSSKASFVMQPLND